MKGREKGSEYLHQSSIVLIDDDDTVVPAQTFGPGQAAGTAG